ncbi:MAG TPA: DUF4388 domain-containing protein [bacterium]|nr:DUF4388 domain-containing protein [bacterium]
MAVIGNIRDLTLVDLFQIVQLGRRTCVLTVDDEHGVWYRTYFADGFVIYADSNKRYAPLGEDLVNAGAITRRQLEAALAEYEAMGTDRPRFGTFLLYRGAIDRETLVEFIQRKIKIKLFDMFLIEDGTFTYELAPYRLDEDITVSISVTEIVMESTKRIDDYKRLGKRIPSVDLVVRKETRPLAELLRGDYEFSGVEKEILGIADKGLTIREMAKALNIDDQLHLLKIVNGFLNLGLVRLGMPEPAFD